MTLSSWRPKAPSLLAVTVSGLYLSLYLHYGVFSFLPLWLTSRDVPTTQIGLLMAIPLLLRLVAVGPVVAWSGRREQLRNALILSTLAAAVLAMSTAMISDHLALLIVFVFFALAWDQLPVLADAYAVLTVRAKGLDFGRLRVWGSLGVVGGSMAGGAIFQVGGIGVFPWVAGGLLVVLAVVALASPTDRKLSPPDESRTEGDWKAVFGDRQMILAMVGTSLIAGSHGVLLSFGVIQYTAAGWSPTLIGLLLATGVLSEVIVLWFTQRILKGGDPRRLILVAGAFAVFRWVIMAFTPIAPLVFFAQLLNGLSAMAPVVGMMLLIAHRTPAHLVGVAQGVNAVILGLGLAIVTLGSGFIWGQGPAFAYGAMAVMALLGLPFLFGRETRPAALAEAGPSPVQVS